jgi:hypothetical protein
VNRIDELCEIAPAVGVEVMTTHSGRIDCMFDDPGDEP